MALLSLPTNYPGDAEPVVAFEPDGPVNGLSLFRTIPYNQPSYTGEVPLYYVTSADEPSVGDKTEGNAPAESAIAFTRVLRTWRQAEVRIPFTEDGLALPEGAFESVGDVNWHTEFSANPVYRRVVAHVDEQIQLQIVRNLISDTTHGLDGAAGQFQSVSGNYNSGANVHDLFTGFIKDGDGLADGIDNINLIANTSWWNGTVSYQFRANAPVRPQYTVWPMEACPESQVYVVADRAVEVHISQLFARIGWSGSQFEQGEYTIRFSRYYIYAVVEPRLARYITGFTI